MCARGTGKQLREGFSGASARSIDKTQRTGTIVPVLCVFSLKESVPAADRLPGAGGGDGVFPPRSQMGISIRGFAQLRIQNIKLTLTMLPNNDLEVYPMKTQKSFF